MRLQICKIAPVAIELIVGSRQYTARRTLKVRKLLDLPFETAVTERYRRRENSGKGALGEFAQPEDTGNRWAAECTVLAGDTFRPNELSSGYDTRLFRSQRPGS